MPSDWYKPSDIRFLPEHVTWIIEHLAELESGRWPHDPRETGYTDVRSPGHGHAAPHETPVGLAAEITLRMDRCGVDGKLTRQCLAEDWDEQTLADLMHTDIYRIRSRVQRVVLYCSGWRRRRLTYYEFSRRHGIKRNYRRVRI